MDQLSPTKLFRARSPSPYCLGKKQDFSIPSHLRDTWGRSRCSGQGQVNRMQHMARTARLSPMCRGVIRVQAVSLQLKVRWTRPLSNEIPTTYS